MACRYPYMRQAPQLSTWSAVYIHEGNGSMKKRRWLLYFPLALTWLLAACSGITAQSMAVTHFDYNKALGDVTKTQLLLNTVKMRYGDTPIFLDVASVVSQYEITGQLNLNANWAQNPLSSYQIFGAAASYADRPTITYNPLMGSKYAQKMMTPIHPGIIIHLIEAGSHVGRVFRLSVQSVNGIQNRHARGGKPRAADPKFNELIESLERLREAGLIGLSVKKTDDDAELSFLIGETSNDEMKKDVSRFREILGLDPEIKEYRLFYGLIPRNRKEIAVQTRSPMAILAETASFIEVPADHIQEGRVNPTFYGSAEKTITDKPFVDILSGRQKPDDSFVSVSYGDRWFWIENRDLSSKRTFSFIIQILSLTEREDKENIPILTIPTR